MAALVSNWLRHFPLLLWNRWTEFNETWQEGRSQRPLPCLWFFSGWSEKEDGPRPLIGWDMFVFFSETAKQNSAKLERNQDLNATAKFVFGPIGKQDFRPGLWLAKTFSTSPFKLLNRIQGNLTESNISMSSAMFVFFGSIGLAVKVRNLT